RSIAQPSACAWFTPTCPMQRVSDVEPSRSTQTAAQENAAHDQQHSGAEDEDRDNPFRFRCFRVATALLAAAPTLPSLAGPASCFAYRFLIRHRECVPALVAAD